MQESSNSFTWTAAAGEAFYCARSALQFATRPAPFLPCPEGRGGKEKMMNRIARELQAESGVMP
ncbi:MAG: hypothetical protein Q8R69_00270, partial [Telluria sp.]|nr:hypothetical protein [Telluria sp.]